MNFLRHGLLKFTIVLSITGVQPSYGNSNPFRDGTTPVALTPGERQELEAYAINSKSILDRALFDANGKPLEEANEIYTQAIIRVVLDSYKGGMRAELLMRYALNQALELTYGIPNADGIGVESPGVLAGIDNSDLITGILEDSIRLALHFYESDIQAIQTQNLTNLPFIDFAQSRIALAQKWLSGIHDWSLSYEFEKAVLGHWQIATLDRENLERLRMAPIAIEVEESLGKIASSRYSNSERVRYLRGLINRVVDAKPNEVNISHPSRDFDNEGVPELTEILKTGVTWQEAKNICDAQLMRLPTARELALVAQSLGAEGISETRKERYRLVEGSDSAGNPDHFYYSNKGYQRPPGDLGRNILYWSSSVHPDYSISAYFLFGPDGYLVYYPRSGGYTYGAVRCVQSR